MCLEYQSTSINRNYSLSNSFLSDYGWNTSSCPIDVGSGHVTCIVHWDVSKNQAGKGLKHAHPRGPALCASASPWDEHAQQVERHMEQT